MYSSSEQVIVGMQVTLCEPLLVVSGIGLINQVNSHWAGYYLDG